MITKFLRIFISILLIFSTLKIINSCRNSEETTDCFPKQAVNVDIYLGNLILDYPSFTYISAEQSRTSRGLIITKINNQFMVYDRNAPHICPDNDTTLEVESGVVICRKDNAKWMLNSGAPIAVSSYRLKYYYWNYNSTTQILSVYN